MVGALIMRQQPLTRYPFRNPLPFPVEEFVVRRGELASWVAVATGSTGEPTVVGHVSVLDVTDHDGIRPDLPDSPEALDALEPGDLDGHSIDELTDYLDAGMQPADPSIDDSPACQNALAAIIRIRHASLRSLEAAARERMRGNLRKLALIDAARLGPRLPGGTVYTDDRAPVEWLVDLSLAGEAG